MNPDPLTLRELAIMAESRGKSEWTQTASLIAIIAGIMHDPKKGKAPTPDDFNPFVEKKKKVIPKVPITVLKDIFCKEK